MATTPKNVRFMNPLSDAVVVDVPSGWKLRQTVQPFQPLRRAKRRAKFQCQRWRAASLDMDHFTMRQGLPAFPELMAELMAERPGLAQTVALPPRLAQARRKRCSAWSATD